MENLLLDIILECAHNSQESWTEMCVPIKKEKKTSNSVTLSLQPSQQCILQFSTTKYEDGTSWCLLFFSTCLNVKMWNWGISQLIQTNQIKSVICSIKAAQTMYKSGTFWYDNKPLLRMHSIGQCSSLITAFTLQTEITLIQQSHGVATKGNYTTTTSMLVIHKWCFWKLLLLDKLS